MKKLMIVLAVMATPAMAIDVSKPDPTPSPEPQRSSPERSKPERSNECPHDHVNRFGGCSPVPYTTAPRPVTNQSVPRGELK